MINFKNIRLVRLPDKAYAVRKGWFFYKYFDLTRAGVVEWRTPEDYWFKFCLTKEYDKANQVYNEVMNNVEVIK